MRHKFFVVNADYSNQICCCGYFLMYHAKLLIWFFSVMIILKHHLKKTLFHQSFEEEKNLNAKIVSSIHVWKVALFVMYFSKELSIVSIMWFLHLKINHSNFFSRETSSIVIKFYLTMYLFWHRNPVRNKFTQNW